MNVSVGKLRLFSLDGLGILAWSHAGSLFEMAGKVVYRSIPQLVGNLGHIPTAFPKHGFGCVNLHFAIIFHDTHAGNGFEQGFQIGSALSRIAANLRESQSGFQPFLHIAFNPLHQIVI